MGDSMSIATMWGCRDLRPSERAVLAAAEAIEEAGETLTWKALAARSSFKVHYVQRIVRKLDFAGLWDRVVVRSYVRRPHRKVHYAGERGTPARPSEWEAMKFRVDPGRLAEIQEQNYRGMGDGRDEIDEGAGGCWCGKADRHKKAEPTNAEAARKALLEWKVVTGRIAPKGVPKINPNHKAANLRALEEIRSGRWRRKKGKPMPQIFNRGAAYHGSDQ